MPGVPPNPDKCHVGLQTIRHICDLVGADLRRNDLVAERGDERGYDRESVVSFVRDQDAKMLGALHGYAGRGREPTDRSPSSTRSAESRRGHEVTDERWFGWV